MTAMRRRFRDINVSARRDGDNWQLALQGRDVDGTAQWFAAAPGAPNGRAVVRLARFALPRARDEAASIALGKGRQIIDEQGDKIFKDPWPKPN